MRSCTRPVRPLQALAGSLLVAGAVVVAAWLGANAGDSAAWVGQQLTRSLAWIADAAPQAPAIFR